MPRKILHLDLDAFFCSVEELSNPGLRGLPFAVGGRPDQRGVISSCSYAARRMGIHSAMPTSRAIRLCPELVIIPGHHRAYGEASKLVMERLEAVTGLVEIISIDEAFLDVTDLPDPGEIIARRLQAQVMDELKLPCSLGVATNKLVAKIANDVGKKSTRGNNAPCAITIVPPGQEVVFLAPLPTEMLWGVGPKTATRLAELGIHTIGELAHWPETDLARRFGENGGDLIRHARGLDDRPVCSGHEEAKSVSQETTFVRDVRDDQMLEKKVRELSAQVGRRLRNSGLAGTTVRIKMRWPDFSSLTRQIRLVSPTDSDEEIARAALGLLHKVRPPGKAVRLIGVGVSSLGEPIRQLSLWDTGSEKARRLEATLDALQERFGDKIIQRGRISETREEAWDGPVSVCGRRIMSNLEGYPTAIYRGQAIYFCTEFCLEAFKRDPDRFYLAHSRKHR
jgi:DNA polymerase-4